MADLRVGGMPVGDRMRFGFQEATPQCSRGQPTHRKSLCLGLQRSPESYGNGECRFASTAIRPLASRISTTMASRKRKSKRSSVAQVKTAVVGKVLGLPSVKHGLGGAYGSSMCQTPSQKVYLSSPRTSCGVSR